MKANRKFWFGWRSSKDSCIPFFRGSITRSRKKLICSQLCISKFRTRFSLMLIQLKFLSALSSLHCSSVSLHSSRVSFHRFRVSLRWSSVGLHCPRLIFKGFMMNLHASRVCSTALGPTFLPPGCPMLQVGSNLLITVYNVSTASWRDSLAISVWCLLF